MGIQANDTFRMLPKKLISLTLHFLDGVFTVFINLRISPNVLTIFALAAGIAAGILFVVEQPFWAGISIIISGLFDIIDGKVAATTNRKSLFGAIFDSTLDRYSEFFIYLGLAYHFRNHWALWLTFFALLGSNMVSYTRARAEGLGIECTVGIMQRAERMVLLFSAAILGPLFKIFNPLMIIALVIIAVLSNLTAVQRNFFVKKVENQRKLGKEA
jgi:CDP-diacylglycerol--glycerol-3-phosphate 3-phosphatidyltransferase